jgi:hypothetical protein
MILKYLYYSTIFSSGYALMETIYRYYHYKKVTTLGQTIITFVWSPMILEHFYYFRYYEIDNIAIILFPFNIWLCEILSGYLSLYLLNKRFWYYDDSLTFFNNTISLYFAPHWLCLGFILQYII